MNDFSEPESPPPAERRVKARARALLVGKITYGEGAFSCTCTIRDFSETGARIAVSASQPLPDSFHLINLKTNIAHRCTVEWRNSKEAGLRYHEAIDLPTLTDPKLNYLQRVWKAVRS